MPSLMLQASRDRASRRAAGQCSDCDISDGEAGSSSNDFRIFRTLFGRPRGSRERKKFGRAWKQWQAQGSGESSAATSSSGAASHGSNGSSRGSGRSSGRGPGFGSAGASAGPQWGHANWTWEDFEQPAGGGNSSAGRGAEGCASWGYDEAWYEPPQGHHTKRTWASGTFGIHFEWYSAWQQHHSSGCSPGTARAGSSVHSNLRLLGLEPANWLESRCGKLLRQAYLARAKAEHPDMHCRSAARSTAEERFKQVQAAYQALLVLVVP